MPNWIEGTFRTRGKKENIKRFLMDGLDPVSSFNVEEKISREIFDNGDGDFTVTFKRTDLENKLVQSLHIAGTRRYFIEDLDGEIYVRKNDKGDFQFTTSFKAAWAISVETIQKIAKEFEIDIKVNGFECGMEFEQTVEVTRNGNIKTDSCVEYDDYDWECKMPLLGG